MESKCQEPGFHHVLTELAFLQIRRNKKRNSDDVIPIRLSGGDTKYLGFPSTETDLILKAPSDYRLFFKLLRHIFIDETCHASIQCIEDCYKALQGMDDISNQAMLRQIESPYSYA